MKNRVKFILNQVIVRLGVNQSFGSKMINKNLHVIMAGMSRAGTSFMYHFLQKHPDLFLPSRKELGYFSHHHDSGFDWYQNFYADASDKQITVDICGVYFTDDESLERIKTECDHPKIILCMRRPTEWIYSFFEQYDGGFDMPSFSVFLDGCSIQREGHEIRLDFTKDKISRTISRYAEEFGDDIMIYDFALFKKDPLYVLNQIESFIGVPTYFSQETFENKKINARGRKRSGLVERALQVKGVVDTILKLFPRKVILALRKKWEEGAAKNVKGQTMVFSDEDKEKANRVLMNDEKYYEDMFSSRQLMTGSELIRNQ